MSDFLDNLKSGMQEAQQKFAVTQQKFVAIQAEHQAITQRLAIAQTDLHADTIEFQAFQTLVSTQTRKEQVATGTPTTVIEVHPVSAAALPVNSRAVESATPQQSSTGESKTDGNKTQAVRDLLRQHPTGMTPSEIWGQLERKLSNRAYLYAVLKRLRDKGDAKERRGKYFLTPKIAEEQPQGMLQ
jgi:hypothetical protein